MQSLKIAVTVFSLALLSACGMNQKQSENVAKTNNIPLTASEKVIQEAIFAHGGDLYKSANYSFVFRKNTYHFKSDQSNQMYSKTYQKGSSTVVDVLNNGSFSRTIDGQVVPLSEKDIASGQGAVNSVIYFATLPYKLNDAAVNSKLKESVVIKGESYAVVEVTFDEAGGGEDHDDQYYYWINTATKKIDYLAYNYSVNNGGVRFRSAYNKRVVDGITFQDYINFEAKVGTPLKDLPALYEAGKLKELSHIKTENVINLNKK